jgi:DNA-binding GntR family transcriptional regulator
VRVLESRGRDPAAPVGGQVPLRPRSFLKDEAYTKIRTLLIEEAEPDQIFSERQLANHFGIGLAAVRSAVERLRVEGFISVAANTGIRLPELTAQSIIDLYEIRAVIEAHIVSSLAGGGGAAHEGRVGDILAKQDECAEHGRPQEYHFLDAAFHIGLAELHGNDEMVRVLEQWRDKTYYLSKRALSSHPDRLRANAAQHRTILQAICGGDGAKAKDLLENHLRWGSSFTLDPNLRNPRLNSAIGSD